MKIDKTCCIVSVATGNYIKGLERLEKSLFTVGYKGNTLFFKDTLPPECPQHDDAPWAFKAFAIKAALGKGYSKVLWLDSNMICIRSPKTIFKKIDKNGYYVMNSYSNNLGEWCSDIALKNLGITREKAFKLFEISPQCLGINAESNKALGFLNEWIAYAQDGITFRGIPKEYPLELTHSNDNLIISKDPRVKGHRHDQAVATYLAWKYNLKRSYCEVKNIQFKNSRCENVYSKAISFAVEFVQNRDIRTTSYFHTVNKWLNNKGKEKIQFMLLSIIDTCKRLYVYINNERKLKRVSL